MELPTPEICYRALQSRDARFDGLLFVGVRSTGIYCRPVCPARTPHFVNCRFFSSAATAQEAGFRPCLRCRPETAPQFASWRGTSNTVSRALSLIQEGALDGEGSTVEKLAARLGVGERQLRRLFLHHLGASPITVAQTRRELFAKQLIHQTRMSIADIAVAAGFGSVRRFHETFYTLFHRPPSALRRPAPAGSRTDTDPGVSLQLRYRPPYDWNSMLAFLQARAIPGLEVVDNGTYARTVEIDGLSGSVEVSHLPRKQSLSVSIRFPEVRALPSIVSRVRRLFDLGADIETIDEHLSRDPLLATLVAERPGLRAPGGWDGFELAVRAILGQQITVAAARRLAGQLVALHGKPLPIGSKSHAAPGGLAKLTHVFPAAAKLARAKSLGLGMPAARERSLQALAEAVSANPDILRSEGTIDSAVERLRSIRGVGGWAAHYIALRAMREMDAFPSTDIGLLRSIARLDAQCSTATRLERRAESWRPWRAYAAQHLWTADATATAARRLQA
ncbi:MAG: AraC family transcriptional regulator [Acidobacteriaceae bacterium]|nr:AraC family transcriptional regulator [Acidobacteriaceae bacterium]